MRKAAERIVAEAKARVPRDSGDLMESIHVEKLEEAVYRVIAGDSDAFYGHMVEFGTVNTSSRPFLMPAYEAIRSDIDDFLRGEFKDL